MAAGSNPHDPRGPEKGTYYYIPSSARNALIVVIGEFCGTFMFLLISFIAAETAITTNSTDATAPLAPFSIMYIAASFGMALAVNVWIFFRVSGGQFNPAVTLGLVLVGAVKPLRALMIVPAQLAAGIAAAAMTFALVPGKLLVESKLAPGVSVVQGLFMEMFLTSQLVVTVYFLAVEKHRATFLAPLGIGASVFVGHMAGVNFSGASLNPARSFGPAVFLGFVSHHWVYWIGPFMGALLAFAAYSLLKWLDYQTANPGQDADDLEMQCRGGLPPMMSGTRNMFTSDGIIKISSDHLPSKDGRPGDFRREGHPLGSQPMGGPGAPYLNVRFSWNKE
ncbi:hypothetical protein CDD83_3412 [Cordyceps sp. RAO-2017]|nr:hypothetical protein CDD83_3412 [Cordyceps sp. RAO-2017]